jgi:hypothetical protein
MSGFAAGQPRRSSASPERDDESILLRSPFVGHQVLERLDLPVKP